MTRPSSTTGVLRIRQLPLAERAHFRDLGP
jgi:hypothetical protein